MNEPAVLWQPPDDPPNGTLPSALAAADPQNVMFVGRGLLHLKARIAAALGAESAIDCGRKRRQFCPTCR